MGTVVGLTSIKRFTYRGQAEEWSNTYHFTGAVPADSPAWRTLYDALVAIERPLFDTNMDFVGGYGYDSDDDSPANVWSLDIPGSGGTVLHGNAVGLGSQPHAPGDVAMWVRWKTSRVTSPGGKPIYLRKYFHGVCLNGAVGGDAVHVNQTGQLSTIGQTLRDGTFAGGRRIRSRLHDETLTGHGVSTNATTRTLKRRGKRPH